MSDPNFHPIRLHGPWQIQLRPQESEVSQPAKLACRLPGDWTAPLEPHFQGRVQLQRHFNRPTGLRAGQPVYLVVEMTPLPDSICLNERPLQPTEAGEEWGASGRSEESESDGRFRFEISQLLMARNHLTIDVELPGQQSTAGASAGAAAEIRLEIAP